MSTIRNVRVQHDVTYCDRVHIFRVNVRTSNRIINVTKLLKSTYNYDDYAQELEERLRVTTQLARERVKEEKAKVKQQYNKRAGEIKFKIGDKVLIYDEMLRRGRKSYGRDHIR